MFLNNLSKKYHPSIALVVYELTEKEQSSDDLDSHYLEAFEFDQDPGTDNFNLGSGKPVTKNLLDSLAEFLSKRKIKQEKVFTFKENRIPPNILFAGQEQKQKKFSWFLNEPKRVLYFSKELNIPTGEVQLPNLVFTASLNPSRISVFAYTDTELVSTSRMYLAPFHNTDQAGVCLGTVKIKTNTNFWEDLIQGAENAFFNSYFTHLNGSNPVKGNLNAILDQCITKKEPFPKQALIPTTKTLNDVI
tara:strand:- start:2395 stop:3135 length:741 start_codon:yes stop_codon:yes gene_type:complete